MTLKGDRPTLGIYAYATLTKIMTIARNHTEMDLLAACLVLLASVAVVYSGEQTEHRDFQYNSVVDSLTGRYNFAYDTGNDNDIAHTMHMQYRDANGLVRGRYGYTDPHGKLRVVEYEAGPNGFVARGDVGPDQFPHDNEPETTLKASPIARYSREEEEELQLVPRPVQMAGWDPAQNPMGRPVTSDATAGSSSGVEYASEGLDGYGTTNNTEGDDKAVVAIPYDDGGSVAAPKVEPYDERYPRISFSANENVAGRELESLTDGSPGDENKSDMVQEYPVASPLNVNNIDVNPDEIRATASPGPVGRSADGDRSRSSRALPYSYRNYRPQTHNNDAEMAIQGTGYRVVYRTPHDHDAEQKLARQTHDHDAERRYYVSRRQTHDHDAERRYYVNRQTHDHDAERRYYANRQTHDHDAERRYYVNRQTHDHDAERRYYVNNRQTHDHDAERNNYYRRVYYRDYYPNRRRIYYRDNHSMVPHEHYSDIYNNDRSHQHSDVHLYGRSQNLQVPATARPRQLKYVPADRYHDKYYYWTD